MIRMLEELVRVIAYGGGGMLIGFWVGTLVNDRHRVITSVLDEAAKDAPMRRRLLSAQALQGIVVIAVMVALLLTGVAWLQADRENAAQDRRECMRSAAVTQTLRERTANYLEAAAAERKWLNDLRGSLIRLGAEPKSPLVRGLDDFRREQDAYVEHLQDNPYPRAEDC